MKILFSVFLLLASHQMFGADFQCDFCKSCDFVEDTRQGDCICKGCGMVVEKIIDHGDEKRDHADDCSGFGLKESRRRTEIVTGVTLSTRIGHTSAGKNADGMVVARKINFSLEQSDQVSPKAQTVKHISDIIKRLHLSEAVRVEAVRLCNDLWSAQPKMRVNDLYPMAAYLVIKASQNSQVPRTFKEVAAALNISKDCINKSKAKHHKVMSAMVDPVEGTRSHASKRHISSEQSKTIQYILRAKILTKLFSQEDAFSLINEYQSKLLTPCKGNLEGRGPATIAAVIAVKILEHASKQCTQQKIAELANISCNTLRAALELCKDVHLDK